MPPSPVGTLGNFRKNFMTILCVCVRSTYKGRTVSLSLPMAARDASVTGAKIYDESYALTCSPHWKAPVNFYGPNISLYLPAWKLYGAWPAAATTTGHRGCPTKPNEKDNLDGDAAHQRRNGSVARALSKLVKVPSSINGGLGGDNSMDNLVVCLALEIGTVFKFEGFWFVQTITFLCNFWM